MKKDGSLLHRIWRLIWKTFLILFIAQLIYIFCFEVDGSTGYAYSIIKLDQRRWLRSGTMLIIRKCRIKLSLLLLLQEDQIFPDHDGFDWKNIEKAMKYNKKKPGRIRGASTISQQVAKNVFLWQGRSWIRKGLEAYFTKMIELLWGKRRILEMYLNVIEMGKGIYGVEAASKTYFNKSGNKFEPPAGGNDCGLLPNPKKYTVKPVASYVAIKSAWILRQMNNLERDPDVQQIIN